MKRPARSAVMRSLSNIELTQAHRPVPRSRLVMNLNRGWRFRQADGLSPGDVTPDSRWERVNLPHSVRLEPLNASGGRNYQGICWYCKNLQISDHCKGRIVYVHFEAAMQVADVWFNGRKLATHHCGYTPFTIDITQLISFGAADNLLMLRLDNTDNPRVPPGKPQRELDFAYFGGLYRNVRLEAMDRLHIVDPILADKVAAGGIFVTYPSVTPQAAIVQVQTDVRNEHDRAKHCTVRQELLDAGGMIVSVASANEFIAAGQAATFTQTLSVPNPRLWHPYHPHLYTLRTIVCDETGAVDDQATRIGIRHLRFDRDDGLFINGQKFLSIGANRHQDHPYVGYALPDSAHWRDVKKLREAGFTSFRSHYPQAPAFMDACDELGMLTIVSNPGWQFVGDEVFRQRAIHNARVMVRRDRNRPSVILWEAALNESDNKALGAALQRAVHEEHPGDQCYTAGDREPGFTWRGVSGWDVEYLHNDGSKPYWIREWGDHVDNWSDQQSANRVARGWGEVPMLVQVWSHLARMNEIMVGHHGSSSGPGARRLCGACLWAGIDCQRGYHHQPFYGGVLDLLRLPKFDYYFFQSQRPPDVHVPGLDDGPMVFIANYATFLSPTAVTVFSNCAEVRLLQNGQEIGVQKPDRGHRIAHPPFTFQVDRFAHERSTMHMNGAGITPTRPGELKAQGIIDGKVVATHIVRPPGAPAKLVLEVDLCGRDLVADGSDWVRVYAKVCDAHGTVCPFADDLISFAVEGRGRIIGTSDIGTNPVRAEAGIATALVQATTVPGRIAVRATAFGLATACAEITSRPAIAWLPPRGKLWQAPRSSPPVPAIARQS